MVLGKGFTLVHRPSNGGWYEPSHPPDWTNEDAIAALISGENTFYFRRVVWFPSYWWHFWTRGQWVRTGEIWEPESGEFELHENSIHGPPPR